MITRSLTLVLVCVALSTPSGSAPPDVLPNTAALELERPLWEVMIDGLDRFCLNELAASPKRRGDRWMQDFSGGDAYVESVATNRDRLRTILGAVDVRVSGSEPLPEPPHRDGTIAVHAFRWSVLDGLTVEGLLLVPPGPPVARVVVIPDAGTTPEQLAGLAEGFSGRPTAQWVAEHRCLVAVPMLISRDSDFSGHRDVGFTNQPHREWTYRPAFEMGRHPAGYEVQKILAIVDRFERTGGDLGHLPIGVTGSGEGGRIALYAAALDHRIQAVRIGGYFEEREGVWREPIDRNVWRLLSEFGDAEIAGLIAPRGLVIDECESPIWNGPQAVQGRRNGAAPGVLRNPPPESVRREFDKVARIYESLNVPDRLVHSPRSDEACEAASGYRDWLGRLGVAVERRPMKVEQVGLPVDPNVRQARQVAEMIEIVQALYRRSAKLRDLFWNKGDRRSVEAWEQSAVAYRDHVHDEMIGRLPNPTMPLNPRSRKVIDEPTHTGYEIVLDVYPDVIAGGILLLPKDLKPGERRPVVVCQHGLEGTPMDTITTDTTSRSWGPYKGFSSALVKRGFVVYAPQNPYKGQDRFRTLQRKSNPLGRSLFSYIIPQHARTLQWLATQPFVDAERIGFYGLSYGGKTAMRVPALLPPVAGPDGVGRPGYCLSICSADFNEWVRKNVSDSDHYSYVFTGEYEIFEWNMGHVANYAELASLISPRPFMVERGHDDGVAPDEWVGWEFAKVRRHYVKLGLADRTEIEWFNGPHTINGQGTYAFLHRHLQWPEPE